MADTAVLVALARVHRDRYARLAEGMALTAGRIWDRYGPVSDSSLAVFEAQTIPIVQAAQRVAAVQTVGYLTAYSNVSGIAVRVPEIDFDALVAGARNGTSAEAVYARPTITARKALSDGQDLASALRLGRARVVETAHTDVMLASRAAEQATMEAFPHVVGYRRVVNPGACNYCLLASTQRYHVRDLRDLHVHCNCQVAPIIGTQDPGQYLNRGLHAQLKQAGVVDEISAQRAAGRAEKASDRAFEKAERIRAEAASEPDRVRQLRLQSRANKAANEADRLAERSAELETRRSEILARRTEDPSTRFRQEVAVREHGELGPTLTDADQHFATI